MKHVRVVQVTNTLSPLIKVFFQDLRICVSLSTQQKVAEIRHVKKLALDIKPVITPQHPGFRLENYSKYQVFLFFV